MKRQLLTIIFICFSVGLFACTCPEIKGLDGKFAGFATMDSLLDHTFLIKVTNKTIKGVTVQIQTDYKNSTELTELFIENMDPSYTCSHSTDKFNIGQQYLIILWSEGKLERNNSLSTCFESFIDVTGNQIKLKYLTGKNLAQRLGQLNNLNRNLN